MYASEKDEPWIHSQEPDPFLWTHSATPARYDVSDLLEDPGNCRQNIHLEPSLHLLTYSVVSEKQKLRHVLNWAETFLGSGSAVCAQFCRADGLLLADAKQRQTESPASAHHQSTAGNTKTFRDEICHLKSSNYEHNSDAKNCLCGYKHLELCLCSLRKDKGTLLERRESGDIRSPELHHPTHKQTSHLDKCTTRRKHKSNQRPHKETSVAAPQLIKESRAAFDSAATLQTLYKNNGITERKSQSKKDKPENQLKVPEVVEWMENNKEELKETDKQKENCTKKMHNDQISSSESAVETFDASHENQGAEAASLSLSPHVERWSDLTVVEQYKVCVEKLQHLRRSQHNKQEFLTQPVEKQALSPIGQCQVKKRHGETGKPVRVAETTLGKRSNLPGDIRSGSEHSKDLTTGECHNGLTGSKTTAAGRRQAKLTGKQSDDVERKAAQDVNSNAAADDTPAPHCRTKSDRCVFPVEVATGLQTDPGFFQNKTGCPQSSRGQQGAGKGPRRTKEARGPARLCESSSNTSSGRRFPSSTITCSQRDTDTESNTRRLSSSGKDTQRISGASETHKLHQEQKTRAQDAADIVNNNSSEIEPSCVAACARWLSLPDELWLSILSLVPHQDLSRVSQVCHGLRTLSTDHTLWKHLKIENCALTDQWFLSVCQRRPRSLSLSSCSSPSNSSCGLEMFLCLCRNSLEELKVTSCTGPGLHGDHVLSLIGQLCEHVTSVDVSWSGATDKGLKALSDGCERLRLKSVVLNGCYITDVPLKKLVMKHKESMCRLEVFGCQFLSPSCLQTVYEMCLGLQHLNIGRVPKVNLDSFTAMTSHLKCLLSLNLTGLQVVDGAVVVTVLKNCVKLESLNLSSCSGVTDLILHDIRKYAGRIRSLDVSGCAAVTDSGLQSLALGCRRLELLDLSSTSTGNRGVSLLANYCSANLHTVKLSFCHITAENILKLCRKCRRLKALHLYGCVHQPTGSQIREVNSAVKVYPSL